MPRVAEVLFDRGDVEPAGNLFGGCDCEGSACDFEQAATLNSSLSDLHSASAPFSTASAWPIASASISFDKLWNLDVILLWDSLRHD
jgi:hypothetical protein